jgi:uncharacterized protein
MKFKNVAELHNKTTEILKYVKQEGYVIITNHGKPEAIIRKFSEDDIEDLVINNNVIKTMPLENGFLISEEKGSIKTQAARKKIINILKNSNASLIKVFGSFARGDFDSNSDIDLIVNFSDRKSLIDLARIEDELENSTGYKIHLLTENSISPHILERVNREAKVIYEKSLSKS